MNSRVLLGIVFPLFSWAWQSLLCLELRFKYESPDIGVTRRFKESFGQELDAGGIVSGCLQSIRANEEGAKLLDRIELLFKVIENVRCLGLQIEPNIRVSFSREKTAFAGSPPANDMLKVSINFNLTESTAWHDTLGFCSLIPAVSRCDNSKYGVGIAADPYWYTVAHELIHMERWLLERLNDKVSSFIYMDELKRRMTEVLNHDPEIEEYRKQKKGNKFISDIIKSKINEKISNYDGLSSALDKHIDSMQESVVKKVVCLFNEVVGVDEVRQVLASDDRIDVISVLFKTFENKLKQAQDGGGIGNEEVLAYFDFLNRNDRFHASYSKNKTVTSAESAQILSPDLSLFPEMEAHKSSKFWESLEERETVVGSRCSELTLRLKDKTNPPIRYLYQPKETIFVESADVLASILGRVDEQYSNKSNLKKRLVACVDPCYFSQRQIRRYINMD